MRRPGKRSKFGVRIDKVGKLERTVDGHVFASKKEAKRYAELKLLERAGRIECLEIQPEFTLEVDDVVLGVYCGDFAYYPCHERGPYKGAIEGHLVVEDSKGVRTELYKWKAKHLHAQYGITIVEV